MSETSLPTPRWNALQRIAPQSRRPADSDSNHGSDLHLGCRERLRIARRTIAFPSQNAALVRTLCDKHRMQELARQHGVPTARSVLPQSKEDVARFVDGAEFPVMVKETSGGRLRARAGGTKFVVKTARELIDLYARVGDSRESQPLIQEFIPGDDWMFDGYFDAGSQCLFGMTGTEDPPLPGEHRGDQPGSLRSPMRP